MLRACFLVIFFLNSVVHGICSLPLNLQEHQWMNEHISKEFAFFKNGIQLEDLEKTWERLDSSYYGRYQVIDSKVSGPEGGIKNLLNVMVQQYRVPDVDFIYAYQQDYGVPVGPIPIFASAKKQDAAEVITFIDWYYDILNNDKPGWNKLIRDLINNQDKWKWKEKTNKLFWRGAITDGQYTPLNWTQFPRGKIVYLSHYITPEEIDAAFCRFSSNNLGIIAPEDADQFRAQVPYSPLISQVDHLQYKYQIALDGVTATYPGFQWRLLSGCVTFKQETDDIMWFYAGLKPWFHYIPVKKDCSDILEKLRWAKAHDKVAHAIARCAKNFALNNLMPEHILLYCYKVLVKYASLQRFTPKPYTKPQPPQLCPPQK